MRVLSIAASAAAILALAATPSLAQKRPAKRPAPAAKPAPKPDPIRLLVTAVAMNSAAADTDLYSACKRANFKYLAIGLEGLKDKIVPEKSEYETETEFAARREKLENGINQDNDVIFCQPLNDNEDAPFDYDAEREIFSGSFVKHQNVWRDVKKTGSYVSKTRMGVRATVTSSVQFEYNVVLSPLPLSHSGGCLISNYSNYSYWLPAPRSMAPILKGGGYLVFMGRLTAPFVEVSDTPGEPTLDDPRDVYEHTVSVYFYPRSLAVVGPDGVRHWECKLIG